MKDVGAVSTAPAPTPFARLPGWLRALIELAVVLTLYVFYSAARLIADTSMKPALERASELLHIEDALGIAWEIPLNKLFTDHQVIGLLGSYWYATLHYVVTGAVLIWLWRLGYDRYGPARRALVIGTLLGLIAYLALPTAPPRFLQGYVDVLSIHAADGWWGTDASAPRGLGHLTNELAAFPSLHAGWSLWVALALHLYATRRWVRMLGWTYAVLTVLVIVGTGNHWVIDAVVGWMVIIVGWALAEAIGWIPLDAALAKLVPASLRRQRPELVLAEEPTALRQDAVVADDA